MRYDTRNNKSSCDISPFLAFFFLWIIGGDQISLLRIVDRLDHVRARFLGVCSHRNRGAFTRSIQTQALLLLRRLLDWLLCWLLALRLALRLELHLDLFELRLLSLLEQRLGLLGRLLSRLLSCLLEQSLLSWLSLLLSLLEQRLLSWLLGWLLEQRLLSWLLSWLLEQRLGLLRQLRGLLE